MRIVINHLTRMRSGHICVAGIDLATGRHIRPIPRRGDLRYCDLAAHGGLFEIGSVVELGRTRPIGKPPETEDHEFSRPAAHRVGELPPDRFWSLLRDGSRTTLIDLFGPHLHAVGRGHAAVDAGHGTVSLGTLLITKQRPELVLEPHPDRARVRLNLKTGRIPLSVAVTDIRLYAGDHVTPSPDAVGSANSRLASSEEVILSVGLSRPYFDWRSPAPERHWLQVNNLHFREEPYWRLPVMPEPPSPGP